MSHEARESMKRRLSKSGQKKVGVVMSEFKRGALRSGSKKGPKVTSRKQAVAIGISEGRKKYGGQSAHR